MLKIGLTGGLGSGKTTAANFFAELDVPVIDADQIARHLATHNKAVLNQIKNKFGVTIFDSEGQLDRRKLRETIFKDTDQRLWLENLLHPLIWQQMLTQAHAIVDHPYCVLVIPLLTEKKLPVDRILLIDTPLHLQLERTQKRDQATVEHVQAILATQAKREERLANADDVIVNDGDLKHLKQQVLKMHEKYLEMLD